MSTQSKLLGFLLVAALVFGAAVGVGRLVGPVDIAGPAGHETHAEDSPESEGHGGHDGAEETTDGQAEVPGGLMTTQDGYTFRLADDQLAPGRSTPVSFTITGPDGAPVTAYDVEHEKRLHLIAVRRDFTGFQHVHPTLADDGTWTTDLALTAGTWRLFADFKATGAAALTLGADLSVAGDYRPAAPSEESRTARVGDYEVTLAGDLTAGRDAKLTLSVAKDGRPVTDLQPYLGAYGHLVALRGGDLAYLHVHPDGTPGDGTTEPGPDVVFYAAVPSEGTYHLYLDFRHDGVVRTARFTVTAGDGGAGDGGGGDGGGGGGGGEQRDETDGENSGHSH